MKIADKQKKGLGALPLFIIASVFVLIVLYGSAWITSLFLSPFLPYCSETELLENYGNLFSATNALFTGLGAAATSVAIYRQYREHVDRKNELDEEKRKREKEMQEEKNIREKEMERASLKESFSRDLENIHNIMSILYYSDKSTAPDENDGQELHAKVLLTYAGHSIDELIYNLRIAEREGWEETFANTDFIIPFIKKLETSFQLISACEPWMRAFILAGDDIKTHGASFPELQKRYTEYLKAPLTIYDKMLIGAYSIAQDREDFMPDIWKDELHKHLSERIINIMNRFFKTYEMKGDGCIARMKIVEEISGCKILTETEHDIKMILLILQNANEKSGILLEDAEAITHDETKARELIEKAHKNGWLEISPIIYVNKNMQQCQNYRVTAEGRDFLSRHQKDNSSFH